MRTLGQLIRCAQGGALVLAAALAVSSATAQEQAGEAAVVVQVAPLIGPDAVAEMGDEAASIARKVGSGGTVSEFRMGMMAVNVLVAASRADGDLAALVRGDGHSVIGFLSGPFRSEPERWVARVDALAVTDTAHRPLRRMVRWTLESLRHIPDEDSSPAARATDSVLLVEALGKVEGELRAMLAPTTY